MTAAHPRSLAATRSIDAATDPWMVSSALTDPDQLRRWLGKEVDLEVRRTIGRRSVLVTDVEPGERVSWLWEADGVVASVQVTVSPSPIGSTVTVDERAERASAPSDPGRLSAAHLCLPSRTGHPERAPTAGRARREGSVRCQ